MVLKVFTEKLKKKGLKKKEKEVRDFQRSKAIRSGTLLGSDRDELDVHAGPPEFRTLAARFKAADNLTLVDGKVPLIWWVLNENFGDLLSPWLVGRMTGKDIVHGGNILNSYIAIGSILRYVNAESIVWGTGSFGPEPQAHVTTSAKYLCVRGPLTRSKILDFGGECPRVYGDPALALPVFYWPAVEKKYDYGLIIRWSEERWRNLKPAPNVKIIDLGTADIRATLKDMLSCRNLASSSLHGLIIADAYGIPNAWLMAEEALGGSRPKGGEYKFYDYFASVNKMRSSQLLRVNNDVPDVAALDYDGRSIEFDYDLFLESCPFLQKK